MVGCFLQVGCFLAVLGVALRIIVSGMMTVGFFAVYMRMLWVHMFVASV
jgi:hypothetical protein